jgi:predicted enzyme related to lactoylglutathione lyase
MSTDGQHSVIYPVKDVAAAKAVYTALFGEPHTDTPYYVGYRVGEQEIGLNPNGHAQGLGDGTVYWSVADLDAAVRDLVAAGGTVRQEPTEVGGGTRLALVADPGGTTVGLITQG